MITTQAFWLAMFGAAQCVLLGTQGYYLVVLHDNYQVLLYEQQRLVRTAEAFVDIQQQFMRLHQLRVVQVPDANDAPP